MNNFKNCEELLLKTHRNRQKNRNETFMFYHRTFNTTVWGNNDELRNQMKIWKKQKKQGILTIDEENNYEFNVDGTMYYTLTLTRLENGNCVEIGFDKLGIGVGMFVDGLVYWFLHKENRDAVFQYVMN
jgi:hypothetical protein